MKKHFFICIVPNCTKNDPETRVLGAEPETRTYSWSDGHQNFLTINKVIPTTSTQKQPSIMKSEDDDLTQIMEQKEENSKLFS